DKSKYLQQKQDKIMFSSNREPIDLLENAIKLKTHFLGYTTHLVGQKQPFNWDIKVIATRDNTGHYVDSNHTLILSLRTKDSYLNYFRGNVELIEQKQVDLRETLDLYRMGWETEHVGKIWVMEKYTDGQVIAKQNEVDEQEELEIDEKQALVDILNTFDQKELQEMMNEDNHSYIDGSDTESDESAAIPDTSDFSTDRNEIDLTDTSDLLIQKMIPKEYNLYPEQTTLIVTFPKLDFNSIDYSCSTICIDEHQDNS
ncbi:hypothetical protein HDV06_003859, partial [Boothiomyces sp. JEL0866]